MATGVLAGEGGKNAGNVDPIMEGDKSFTLPVEFDVTGSYVGSGDVRRDGHSDSLDEHDERVSVVFTPRTPVGILRLGAEYERYSFGFDANTPLPNTLQAVNLVIGLDTKFSDSILVRVEAQPGLYGTFFNHVTSGDFNVPFLVGGTYLYSDAIQFILGVGVDVNRKYPVIPGVGVRWKLAPKLVLNAVLPTPRLEFELSKATTLYAGAELKEEDFRMDEHFGDNHLDNRHDERVLNHALVTFSEVRAGVGLTQRLSSSLTLSAEGGCQPVREFDFYRADARYRSDGVAPYGQIALHGAF